jgi:alkylation response protein AidB-like acyl-CoA dehydrogenase
MDAEAYRLHTYITVSRLLDDTSAIGAEASLNKVFWSEMDLKMHETALQLLGPQALLETAAPDSIDKGAWLDGYLFSLSGPIYAGTNEIQRSVIADQVLRLPRARQGRS